MTTAELLIQLSKEKQDEARILNDGTEFKDFKTVYIYIEGTDNSGTRIEIRRRQNKCNNVGSIRIFDFDGTCPNKTYYYNTEKAFEKAITYQAKKKGITAVRAN